MCVIAINIAFFEESQFFSFGLESKNFISKLIAYIILFTGMYLLLKI